MVTSSCCVVVPWVTEQERDDFLIQWKIETVPDWLVMQQDSQRQGCGVTKNRGVQEALRRGAEVVVVLDGDCYPSEEARTLLELMEKHLQALEPQEVELYESVTVPPSRGTPYSELSLILPVAASMGFWLKNGDHCAVRQLAFDNAEMQFVRRPIFGRYFSLCGMNLAFRPREWRPWCNFIDVARFDDIWMGWLWQREAYRRGYCFNLNGPLITHSRQSNVWKNLRAEAVHLEKSEILWCEIAQYPQVDYKSLRGLLPV